jgi:hypothetical protein
MNDDDPATAPVRRYRFPAKTYGWGWGSPAPWQGWTVMGGYIALMLLGAVLLNPQRHLAAFVACTAAFSALLLMICWRTGEAPRWRWGKQDG